MATTINTPIASVDTAGDVISVTLSGTCDECTDLRVEVADESGDLLCTGPVVFNGENWSKTFNAPDDFTSTDIICDKQVNVTLKCHDTSPAQTLQSKTLAVSCTGCSLTVEGAEGTPAASGLQQLVISGTASCPQVNVIVTFQGEELHQDGVPVTSSQWQAIFVENTPGVLGNLKRFDCKDVISVKVTCQKDRTCFIETSIPVTCVPPKGKCPDAADVLVTGLNNFSQTNPTDAELECLPAGDYTIQCTNVASAYVWRSGDTVVTGANTAAQVVSVNGDTMVISLQTGDNRHFSVSPHISTQCTPLRTVAFHCGGKVDCVVSEFSNWSPCINGTQTRTRTIITPPSNGGRRCPPLTQTRPCPPDAVDCVVSNWSRWSPCVKGQRTRTRTIVTPASNGGRECPALTQTEACTDVVVNVCIFVLFLALGLAVVAAILALVACCMMDAAAVAAILAVPSGGTLAAVSAALDDTIINLLIIAAIIAAIALLILIGWIIFCLFGNLRTKLCDWVDFILGVLHFLILASGVLAVILGVIGHAGCAIGAVVDIGWFGILEQIFFWIGAFNGCIDWLRIFNSGARTG